MKHLYFVRHGLSVMNKKGIFSGRTDTPLAPEGVKQCEEAGREAKALGIDFIVCSPMERARETAALIAQQIGYPVEEIAINELFMERDFGSLEGTLYSTNRDFSRYPDVESDEQILERARKGLEYLRGLDYDNILVVSHGAIGRALRHILEPDVHFHDTERFENGKIVQLL